MVSFFNLESQICHASACLDARSRCRKEFDRVGTSYVFRDVDVMSTQNESKNLYQLDKAAFAFRFAV